jgi:hypothetical protein
VPVLKVYHHGLTAGVPPTVNAHQRALRGDVGGWSAVSIRSNTRFLYSVEEQNLTGTGFAITLTVRDCPPTHDDWHQMRRAFVKRLERMGLIRMHWVTEWQRRGVPHLHGAVWFPASTSSRQCRLLREKILAAWVAVAGINAATRRGQHAALIVDSVGWFKYLSKHAARGLKHYQRSPEGIPAGWKKTGRMWGYLGDWPIRQAMELRLDTDGYHAFRRMVRGYRVGNARKALRAAKWDSQKAIQARRRIKQARSMLRCHDRRLSSVRGVSEWIETNDQLLMVHCLAGLGYQVEHVGTE